MDCLSEESCRCGAVVTRQLRFDCTEIRATIRGGGVLPDKRLIGMCCWMGSHFHHWSDYNGVGNFRIFGVIRDSKWKDSGLKNQKVVVY